MTRQSRHKRRLLRLMLAQWLRLETPPHAVITPHPGEAARLLKAPVPQVQAALPRSTPAQPATHALDERARAEGGRSNTQNRGNARD